MESGSLLLGVMASVAKFEASGRVAYVKACQRKRVEHGLFVGHAPYGYENYRDRGRRLIRVHQREAATVRRIFELYATGQFTVRSLIAELWRPESRSTSSPAAR